MTFMPRTSSSIDADTLTELQMITGVVSKDVTYLYYLLIKDGSYFEKIKKPEMPKSDRGVLDLESWFNSL